MVIALTNDVVNQILKRNEGMTRDTIYNDGYSRIESVYRIINGVLTVTRNGKDEEVCDFEQTKRFIMTYIL